MKNLFSVIAVILFLAQGIVHSQTREERDDYYFKINKSFDIYGAVFRELNKNYVLELDPERLMESGISGMLRKLDPYTVFIDESASEDIDILTSGSYVGLGITVATIDSMLTITGLDEHYSAYDAGIRVGDRLYKIDTAVVLYESSDKIRKYTSGTPDSYADVRILRDGINDTLNFRVQRREIEVRNVSYSGMINDSVGIIKLDRFSRLSSIEVNNAFKHMKENHNLKGLILDLRNNPGGLLDAAVSICELFLPDGSPIVSTRGRNKADKFIYKSDRVLHDTTIRIAVLINRNSASASEVVAGAMQDLDRGIIVGERSFGKGLVQSVYDLPYNKSLKITTARYYTPSGRCIQRIDYFTGNDMKLIKNAPADSVFYTKNRRRVYEKIGIEPDSTVTNGYKYTDFIRKLYEKNLVFNFANIYSSRYDSLPADFEVDGAVLNEFRQYLKDKNFDISNPILGEIGKVKDLADDEKISPKSLKLLARFEKSIEPQIEDQIELNKKELKRLMGLEIMERFLPESKIIGLEMIHDKMAQTAATLLEPVPYYKILDPGD